MNLEKNRTRNDPAIRQHRENGRTGSYQWDEALARIFQAGCRRRELDIREVAVLNPIVESAEKQKARQRAHLAELDAPLKDRAFKGEL